MRFTFLFAVIVWLNSTSAHSQENSISWEHIKESRKGTVTIFWFANNPFSYKDASGLMKGIEVEIMDGFRQYLHEHYDINLSYRWKEEERFNDVLTRMKEEKDNCFGLAGLSVAKERRAFMKFSPSYIADYAVLVSTPDIPIARSKEDLIKYLEGATALATKGTLVVKELIQLRDENKIQFNIEYTKASEELINVLNTRRKSFGYISLPVYLMNLDKGAAKVNRQNYLTKRYEGRGIGLPKTSDWDAPLNEYFSSAEFKQDIESIIAKYVNLDLYHFIETFNPENEVSLLNKEKDIQEIKLKVQDLTIRETNQRLIYLLIIISVGSVLLFVIIILFRRLRQNLNQLKEQKMEIEAQADQIQAINNNLERMIKDRTSELENKNKSLEEYAFITAHKLRSPLATILGLVSLIEMMKFEEEDKIVIAHLKESAKKLDKIVHSVMDAIDNSESPDQSNNLKNEK